MSSPLHSTADQAEELRQWWASKGTDRGTEDPAVAAGLLAALSEAGFTTMPLPGHGSTGERFTLLAAIGELDLTLARLIEAHVDATAICAELGAQPPAAAELWGVWAAEPPTARVIAERRPDGDWVLSGRKAWCSGAGIYTHALITAHAVDGPRLFAVALDTSGVTVVSGGWSSDALTGADTRSVELRHVVATPVGEPDRYVERPGFWHGAAGVAAVWYGGAVGIARTLAAAAAKRTDDEILLAHLGAVDVALGAARASLDVAAAHFDADPNDRDGQAAVVARRTRGVGESSVTEVIDRVGRALGAAPLAMDRAHSRRVADLTLYVRQSHADVDLADLGRRIVKSEVLW